MGEKICNDAPSKGLPSKVCKQLVQLNTETNNPIKQWTEDQVDISPKKIYRWSTGTWKEIHITNY